MDRTDMMKLLINRIEHCYKQLVQARTISRHSGKEYVEGLRCRLDELILYYHLVRNISFVEACNELNIDYHEVNMEDKE